MVFFSCPSFRIVCTSKAITTIVIVDAGQLIGGIVVTAFESVKERVAAHDGGFLRTNQRFGINLMCSCKGVGERPGA